MTKFKIIEDDDELLDDNGLLRDQARLRVPLTMMDAMQRSVYEAGRSQTVDADTMVLDDGLEAGLHKPGPRHIATDAAAVTRIQMARDAYEADLCNRWRNTPPEPLLDTSAAVSDEEWDSDEDEDFYAQYDARIQDAWRSR